MNVWGQRYTDVGAHRGAAHARPVRSTRRSCSTSSGSPRDALLELFQLEIDVLREVTPDIAVTTNFMSLLRDLDYWDFAAVEDLVTDDAYPDPADPARARARRAELRPHALAQGRAAVAAARAGRRAP